VDINKDSFGDIDVEDYRKAEDSKQEDKMIPSHRLFLLKEDHSPV